MFVINKKQKIIGIIIASILLVGVGILLTTILQNRKFANTNVIEKELVNRFQKKPSYDFSVSTIVQPDSKPTVIFKGSLNTNKDVDGTYTISGKDYKVLSNDSKVYMKSADDKDWQDGKPIIYEVNVSTHPEWIQIQKRLPDVVANKVRYLQYSVIFEKPDQEMVKNMPQEVLDSLQIRGSVLLEKDKLLLKSMKLHQGKDENGSYDIEYIASNKNISVKLPK